jgi:hypothetical protein
VFFGSTVQEIVPAPGLEWDEDGEGGEGPACIFAQPSRIPPHALEYSLFAKSSTSLSADVIRAGGGAVKGSAEAHASI